MRLYATIIFSSAFLLFLIQPLMAKQISPWFGGSSAVWATCMVFFQFALLLGYAYADWVVRRLAVRSQVWLHIALLLISCLFLPVLPDPGWKPDGTENPSLRILGLLLVTIALPYFLLASTSPLLQSWLVRTHAGKVPYKLFALSNLASLLALLAYPFAIEPHLTLQLQGWLWSTGYVCFALLCALCAARSLRVVALPSAGARCTAATPAPVSVGQKIWWGACAAAGSFMMLAVSNHISQNVASVPFLWIGPLAVYLLTFILCFDGRHAYQPRIFRPLLLIALLAVATALTLPELTLTTALPFYLAALFILCMYCHGELVLAKPAPQHLTTFYLMISAGGAAGSMLVGLAAPYVLPAVFELQLGVAACGLLALFSMRLARWPVRAATGAAVLLLWLGSWASVDAFSAQARVMKRNFYGGLSIRDGSAGDPPHAVRTLLHGTIAHGAQHLDEAHHSAPTTYYGPSSGVGVVLASLPPGAQRIGVIGLGAGTLAAWGREGDTYRFYEIDPQVVDIAATEFDYLKRSQARVEVVLGDARLRLERETNQRFDVLIIDAFSGDSIPTHLLTREAFAIYRHHMRPNGVIAVHVSNRYLVLDPVVAALAHADGLPAFYIHDDAEASGSLLRASRWMLVPMSKSFTPPGRHDRAAFGRFDGTPVPAWSDDFSNLLQTLR
jgi:SAM-dependent methyltransferase